jgi:hypothetical protein
MKKIIVMSMLASVMMLFGTQQVCAKKVIVNTNGSSVYHTWAKCKDLKAGGLSAKVSESDAVKDGKSFCSVCRQHEADVAADKAKKKAERAEKKAKAAKKKAEKHAQNLEKAQKAAAEQAEKAARGEF